MDKALAWFLHCSALLHPKTCLFSISYFNYLVLIILYLHYNLCYTHHGFYIISKDTYQTNFSCLELKWHHHFCVIDNWDACKSSVSTACNRCRSSFHTVFFVRNAGWIQLNISVAVHFLVNINHMPQSLIAICIIAQGWNCISGSFVDLLNYSSKVIPY